MNKIIFIDFGIFLHRSIFASLNTPKIPATYTCLGMIISNLDLNNRIEDDKNPLFCAPIHITIDGYQYVVN